MNATHRDHEPTAARSRLAAPAVLAVMTMLPQLGCAHHSDVARQDGLSRTLRTVDPGLVPGGAVPRAPDRADPPVPMIGADRAPGPGMTSGPDGSRLAVPHETEPTPGTRLLAACWETKIPPPRLRLAPPVSRPDDDEVGARRWSSGLFAACEAAGIGPPVATRAIGPAADDELLAACAITRIPPPITLGLRWRAPASPLLAIGLTLEDSPNGPTAPPPVPPVLAGGRFRREFAEWDQP